MNAKRGTALGSAIVAVAVIVVGIAWKAVAGGMKPSLSPQQQQIRTRYEQILATINLDDGVDQREASQIANLYYSPGFVSLETFRCDLLDGFASRRDR